MHMKPPIYLALDFPTWQETETFLNENQLHGVPVKVGMELFYREGPPVIKALQQHRHPIFLDLKLHDIPTTIYKAMKNVAALGVDFVNVHGLGGADMIRAAKQGLIDGSQQNDKQPKLLVVTVLTSMNQATVTNELQIDQPVEELVTHLANIGKDNGADGVVCSAHEVAQIKAQCGEAFLTITPGIRLNETEQHDQKRVATPQTAHQLGSDYIVIGRSITKAAYPNAMYQQAIKEWNHVS